MLSSWRLNFVLLTLMASALSARAGVEVQVKKTNSLRRLPSLDGDEVGRAEKGEKLEALKVNSEKTWVYVKGKLGEGWIPRFRLNIPTLNVPPLEALPESKPKVAEVKVAPPPPPAPEPEVAIERPTILEFLVSPYYSQINTLDTATSSISNLVSKTNFGVGFNWYQQLSSSTQSEVKALLRRESYFGDSANTSLVLTNSTQLLYNIGLAFHHQATNRFTFFEDLEFMQELFAVGLANGTGVDLKRALIPKLGVGGDWRFIKAGPLYMSAGASGWGTIVSMMSAGFSTKWGYGYESRLGIIQTYSRGTELGATFYYRFQLQNSTISENTKDDAGLRLGLKWAFDI